MVGLSCLLRSNSLLDPSRLLNRGHWRYRQLLSVSCAAWRFSRIATFLVHPASLSMRCESYQIHTKPSSRLQIPSLSQWGTSRSRGSHRSSSNKEDSLSSEVAYVRPILVLHGVAIAENGHLASAREGNISGFIWSFTAHPCKAMGINVLLC